MTMAKREESICVQWAGTVYKIGHANYVRMLKDIERRKKSSPDPKEYGGQRLGYLMGDVAAMLPEDAKSERELFKETVDRWKAFGG